MASYTDYQGDFLNQLEDALTKTRRQVADAADRADALVELVMRARVVSEQLKRPLKPEDLRTGLDELELGRLTALVNRALTDNTDDNGN